MQHLSKKAFLRRELHRIGWKPLALLLVLPVLLWAIVANRFDLRKKAAVETSICTIENNRINVTPPGGAGACHDLQTAIDTALSPNLTIELAPGIYDIPKTSSGFSIVIRDKANLRIMGSQLGHEKVHLQFVGHTGGILVENSSGELSWMKITGNTSNGLLSLRGGLNKNFSIGYTTLYDSGAHTMDVQGGDNISVYNTDISSLAGGLEITQVTNINIGNNTIHDADNGLSISDSSGRVFANKIINNRETGIRIYNGNNLTITGNTIANNGQKIATAGVYAVSARQASHVFEKNIVAFNKNKGFEFEGSSMSALFRLNDTFGHPGGNYIGVNDPSGENGNISQDPKFGGGNDFCLNQGSPAIYGIVANYEYMGHRGPCPPTPLPTNTCIPRPPCLDAEPPEPRCMIAETPDMCPRVIRVPTPTIHPACKGKPNGTFCQIVSCAICPTGVTCPAAPCVAANGICQNQVCYPSTYRPTPTPPVGCTTVCKQVQCIQAPCDPICETVCPNPTPPMPCTPLPTECVNRPYPDCVATMGMPPYPWCPPVPPATSCTNKPDGTQCTSYDCPACPPNSACTQVCYPRAGKCANGNCRIIRPTPFPTSTQKYCTSDSQCPKGQYCYQPPKPICQPNQPCPYGMPPKYCMPVPTNTKIPVPTITKTPTPTKRLPSLTPTPTPMIYCSLPRCAANEILYCNGNCPGGCGFRCVTPTPSRTPTSTKTPTLTPTLTATIVPTLTPTPTTAIAIKQTLDFRFRFTGVSGEEANGAQVVFIFRSPSTYVATPPVIAAHYGNGVYRAQISVESSHLHTAGGYEIFVKGEKHIAKKFCRQSGQTPDFDCSRFNIEIPYDTVVFDFTGVPLEPGDLPTQDNKADSSDFAKIKTLMNKSCSALTALEKKIADLDYNGCVNVRDAFLMRKTLETRYDEN